MSHCLTISLAYGICCGGTNHKTVRRNANPEYKAMGDSTVLNDMKEPITELTLGNVPEEWRLANVAPVFKNKKIADIRVSRIPQDTMVNGLYYERITIFVPRLKFWCLYEHYLQSYIFIVHFRIP